MKFNEFGEPDHPTVLLLCDSITENDKSHPLVSYLENHYRVIMPVLAKQQPNQQSRLDAESIASYVTERCHGRVHAICSTAGSWTVMNTILSNTKINSELTVIENPDILPGEMILSSLIETENMKRSYAR